jgi:hypothetical protein
MLKRYQLGYHHTSNIDSYLVPGQITTFSSYPGVIHSQDDFYLVVGGPEFGKKHQLAVLGTAFNCYNRTSLSSLDQEEQVMTRGLFLNQPNGCSVSVYQFLKFLVVMLLLTTNKSKGKENFKNLCL